MNTVQKSEKNIKIRPGYRKYNIYAIYLDFFYLQRSMPYSQGQLIVQLLSVPLRITFFCGEMSKVHVLLLRQFFLSLQR